MVATKVPFPPAARSHHARQRRATRFTRLSRHVHRILVGHTGGIIALRHLRPPISGAVAQYETVQPPALVTGGAVDPLTVASIGFDAI